MSVDDCLQVLAGFHQRSVVGLPSRQYFGSDEESTFDVDLRLEEGDGRVVGDRPSNPTLTAVCFADLCVSRGQLDAVAPLVFGRTHGPIGGSQHVGRGVRVPWTLRQADTQRDTDESIIHGARRVHHANDRAGEHVGTFGVDDHDELVPTETSHDHRAIGETLESAGHLSDQHVAGVMSEAVVESFEPIDVAEENREVRTRDESLLDARQNRGPVEKSGQRVVGRAVLPVA